MNCLAPPGTFQPTSQDETKRNPELNHCCHSGTHPAGASPESIHAMVVMDEPQRARSQLALRKLEKAITDPVDHRARGGIALEVVLHQQPYLASPRQQRCPQAAVGQQACADIFRQDADGLMGLDQRLDHADIVGDAARARLQSPCPQKLRLRDRIEILGIEADDRFGIGFDRGLEEIQPDIGKFRDREIALVRLAQANGEIRLPSREVDVLAGGQKLKGQARVLQQESWMPAQTISLMLSGPP